MKRLLFFFIALSLTLGMLPVGAFATETTAATEPTSALSSADEPVETTEATEATKATEATEATEETRPDNACGENLTWEFKDGTLTIRGNGAMDDFAGDAPWAAYKKDIQVVALSGNISTIGAGAFADYDAIVAVDFGRALQEIGTAAFKGCDGLTTISLPDTFRRFGEESFSGCANLTEIHCDGGMPSFNQNCLWNTWAKIYFPEERPWPLVHIQQLEEAFKGRIEFLASDGSDPYVPTEPKETEDETKPEETTAPPTTEAPTQAPTEPAVTEAATQPAVTEEPTQPSRETEPSVPAPQPTGSWEEETEPERETEPEDMGKTARKGFGGLAIISGVLCLLILGALVFRGRRF